MLGENDIAKSYSYNTLANVYINIGEYKKAEKLLKKCLRIRESILVNYYVKAYKIYTLFLGRDHFHARGIYKDMQMLWYRINTKGNFTQWLEEQMREIGHSLRPA